MNDLPKKDRLKIPRQTMPSEDPEVRAQTYDEVNLGLPEALAQQEAMRCLSCKGPTCVAGCPVGVKIGEFIDLVTEGKYLEAAKKIREDNVLPAITGRVCPQENQCEKSCVVSNKHDSIAIGNLERFVADFELAQGQTGLPDIPPATGKKVAIVGSGPAGLACAGDLIQKGHAVTVFEALHELGGVLVYGIPRFRLPRHIVKQELDNLRAMGVVFKTNYIIGQTLTLDELFNDQGYHAAFIATGAGLPTFMNIPGESLPGVFSANEWLTRINLMGADQFPDYDQPVFDCKGKSVAVIGGGNTAMDAIRSAVRMGASKAAIIYRRTREAMPARIEEVEHALEEGIALLELTSPLEFLGNQDGFLSGVKCQRMELGEPDDSGRRRPMAIEGDTFTYDLDAAIIAIGTSANPLLKNSTPQLKLGKWGYIEVNPETLETSIPMVYAGGDIVTGAATVIEAMGQGRQAAKAMHTSLSPDSGQNG